MKPVTYHKRLVLGWSDEFLLVSLIFLITALGWGFITLVRWDEREWHGNYLFLLVTVINLMVAAGWFRWALPAHNSLTLDRENLIYTRGGSKGIWSWRELPPLALERGLRGPRIKLPAPKEKERLRLIEDVWDTPLDQVAAKLNEYRERALAS